MSEMKIKFKKQQYQSDAVASVVDCFKGQIKSSGISYRIDPGKQVEQKGQAGLFDEVVEDSGFKNSDLSITNIEILNNIKTIQQNQNLPISENLVSTSVCSVNLDVEMETGTGKTYVYVKTMFEMYEKYGWSKFIIVVPSIAIREGIYQSIERPLHNQLNITPIQ